MNEIQSYVRERAWLRDGVGGKLAWLALRPLATAFGLGVRVRNAAYTVGVLRAAQPALPVVSVGNLTVGGAGKTPFALWLAETLRGRGYHPAIVLRGYRGSSRETAVVGTDGRAAQTVGAVGDEAVMLARRFRGTVVVSRRRIDGIALARERGCDIAVLDDGFQHRQVARDCDVVLVSSGKAPLLPAGPFREPFSALRRADVIVRVRKDGIEEPQRLDLVSCPIFEARFRATALVESLRGEWRERPVGLLAGRRVATVSGIADPRPFHDMVRQWEAQIVEIITLEDHHTYTVDDWRRIANRTREVDLVLTTEKDLVKLETFPFAREKLLALRIAPEVDRAEQLIDLVSAHLEGAKRGGAYGHQSGVARDSRLSEV